MKWNYFKCNFRVWYFSRNDITSIYFERTYEDSDIITYGYSRDDKPDKTTVIGNRDDIVNLLKETSLKKIRPIVVGDRAMLNNKIIAVYHKRADMDYLGALLTDSKKGKLSKE